MSVGQPSAAVTLGQPSAAVTTPLLAMCCMLLLYHLTTTADHVRCMICALSTCRSGKVLGWSEAQKSWTNAVFFGWNAVVEQQGRIAVGDTVQAFVQPSG